jgi:6-pyruvoyltetrahydropterin/6-carboxytetrahydropterin synthase
MIYTVDKHYPHSLGLSACFRQWRASSHCRYPHGYALAFTLRFASPELSPEGWVIDFGALKPVKDYLVRMFDHQMLVATDDPAYDDFASLHGRGILRMRPVERTGCEAFATMVGKHTADVLAKSERWSHVSVSQVTCHEHDANSATVQFT